MPRELQLVDAFVEAADTLVDDFDLLDFLHRMTVRCVELVDVDAAGLMLADHQGGLRVMATSSERVRLIELFEIQNDEGPCLDCYRTAAPVACPDLDDAGPHWARFARLARDAGFRAVHALPMRLRHDIIGVLNLFRVEAGALPEADLRVAQAMADVSMISLLQQRAIRERQVLVEQLQETLDSRIVIEQAKGVLAERLSVEMDEAFERMRDHGRQHNLRLAQVAGEIVAGRLKI
ncbi:ANTAR domain-containing protein [Phytohabitans kaempferiae]|uniref:ANTAR domain-containing protein n=1 Tax=Phytohabitans kaempferiae TaxID=1620943 RepID=A0ABV6MAP0_9ACTN